MATGIKSSSHRRQSPGEMKRREVELDSHRESDNRLFQLPLHSSCFLDTGLYLTLHCHHQKNSALSVRCRGSEESHFDTSLMERGKNHKTVSTMRGVKITRQCPQTTFFSSSFFFFFVVVLFIFIFLKEQKSISGADRLEPTSLTHQPHALPLSHRLTTVPRNIVIKNQTPYN